MASYNRSRHAYETFIFPDDTDTEEEAHELVEASRRRMDHIEAHEDQLTARGSVRRLNVEDSMISRNFLATTK